MPGQESWQTFRKPSVIWCNQQIVACKKGLQWREAQQLFQSIPTLALQANIISFISAISCCTWRRALLFLAAAGAQNNVVSYTAATGKFEEWPHAIDSLNQMELKNVQPNLFTYSRIAVCCTSWCRGVQLLHDVMDKGLEASMILDSAVLTTCAQSAAWESALDILGFEQPVNLDSLDVGFAKDVVAFASAITACEKAGQWEWAIHLLRRAGQKLQLNAIIYSAAISACEKASIWQAALLLMEEAKPIADVIAFNSTISACEKASRWLIATFWLQQLGTCGLQANIVTFNASISACKKSTAWQHALLLHHACRCRALKSDVITFSATIKAVESDWNAALSLLSALRFQGLLPDLTLFNSLLGGFQSWVQTLQLQSEMTSALSTPDILTHQTVISTSIQAAHWKHAIAFLEVDGHKREMVSFNALLASLERWKSYLPQEVLSKLFSRADLRLQNVFRS